MVFWIVVAVIVLVVLGLALRNDRRHRGSRVNPDQPAAARARTEAQVQHERTSRSEWNNAG